MIKDKTMAKGARTEEEKNPSKQGENRE